MGIETCPTTIVGASAERIWKLLTTPAELERWSGVRLRSGPAGPMASGDRLVLGAGMSGRNSGRTLAVVAARGGSKGIPHKNLIDLCGKPLIAWTVLQEIGRASCRERVCYAV